MASENDVYASRQGFLAAWSDPIDTTQTYPKEQVPNPDSSEGARLQDAGVRVKALSRWNNYYTAGLKQIMRDYNADGIYLGKRSSEHFIPSTLHSSKHSSPCALGMLARVINRLSILDFGFRVGFQSRPYNVSGGFGAFRDVSACFGVGG